MMNLELVRKIMKNLKDGGYVEDPSLLFIEKEEIHPTSGKGYTIVFRDEHLAHQIRLLREELNPDYLGEMGNTYAWHSALRRREIEIESANNAKKLFELALIYI